MKTPILTLAILLMVLLLPSCGKGGGETPVSDDLEKPNMAFTDVTYTLGRSQFPPVRMSASEMELYNDRDLALLRNVSFSQTDDDGSVLMTGTCDRAEIDTGTYAAKLLGKVSLDRPQDALSLRGEDVTWDNERQRISTDKAVVLLYDGSSEIEGTGLTCDFKTSRYEFDRITEGRLVPKQ